MAQGLPWARSEGRPKGQTPFPFLRGSPIPSSLACQISGRSCQKELMLFGPRNLVRKLETQILMGRFQIWRGPLEGHSREMTPWAEPSKAGPRYCLQSARKETGAEANDINNKRRKESRSMGWPYFHEEQRPGSRKWIEFNLIFRRGPVKFIFGDGNACGAHIPKDS